MAVQPLGTLFNQTITFIKMYWVSLLIGAAVIGCVHAALQVNMRQKAVTRMGGIMNQIENNSDKMKDVMDRMQGGDEEAAKEFADMMKGVGEEGMGMTEGQVKSVMMGMLPSLGGAALISLVVSIIGGLFFVLLALSPQSSVGTLAQRVPGLILPFVGLWLWMFIRSFAWIPFIGIITGLYYYPRFAAAPVYLVEQNKGIMDSVKMSMDATQYYWGKIFGNALAMGVCMLVLSLIGGFIFGMIGGFIGILLTAIFSQFLMGAATFFGIQLARTVMQNPLRPAKA